MPIFKTYLRILQYNKLALALGLIISMGITILFVQTDNNSTQNFALSKAKVAIFNEDTGSIGQYTKDYLKDTMKEVTLKDDTDTTEQALFFGQVDYIIRIPKGFSASFGTENQKELSVNTTPNTFTAAYVTNAINRYLSTFKHYQEIFPEKDEQTIAHMATTAIQQKGQVIFDANYSKSVHNQTVARAYDILAYGFFATLFSGIAVTSLAFNKKEIFRRNSCSSFSQRKISRHFYLATILFAACCLVISLGYLAIFTNFEFSRHILYWTVNTLVFTLAIMSLSIFIAGLIANEDLISAVNNILILGCSFIGGVFVPISLLPNVVQKIASFTPTYWFVKSNTLVGNHLTFDSAFYSEWGHTLLILLLFALVFFIFTMISKRERGGLKIFSRIPTKSLQ